MDSTYLNRPQGVVNPCHSTTSRSNAVWEIQFRQAMKHTDFGSSGYFVDLLVLRHQRPTIMTQYKGGPS
jgi:hypothetical protein